MDTHRVTRGCPQGSCVGPILWLLIAEDLLRNIKLPAMVTHLAYADDFLFTVSDTSRRPMEQAGKVTVQQVESWLQKHSLQVSESKCTVTHILLPNRRLWKRPPIYKINGRNIASIDHFLYLGLTINKNLTWNHHLKRLQVKLHESNKQLQKVTRKCWGVNSDLLKLWYKTVTLKQVTYDAAAWAANLQAGGGEVTH